MDHEEQEPLSDATSEADREEAPPRPQRSFRERLIPVLTAAVLTLGRAVKATGRVFRRSPEFWQAFFSACLVLTTVWTIILVQKQSTIMQQQASAMERQFEAMKEQAQFTRISAEAAKVTANATLKSVRAGERSARAAEDSASASQESIRLARTSLHLDQRPKLIISDFNFTEAPRFIELRNLGSVDLIGLIIRMATYSPLHDFDSGMLLPLEEGNVSALIAQRDIKIDRIGSLEKKKVEVDYLLLRAIALMPKDADPKSSAIEIHLQYSRQSDLRTYRENTFITVDPKGRLGFLPDLKLSYPDQYGKLHEIMYGKKRGIARFSVESSGSRVVHSTTPSYV